MGGNEIKKVDISHFMATESNGTLAGDEFFVTDDIYPYLREKPGRLEFYAIALCLEGYYKSTINLREYTLTKNCFAVFKPHQITHMLEIKDYKGVLIVFNRSFFSALPDSRILEMFDFFDDNALPVVEFNDADATLLMEYFGLLRERAAQVENVHRSEITRHLLMALLYEINAVYRQKYAVLTKTLSRKEELARRFHDLLMQHFKEQRSVQFYADALSITPKYLSELLKEVEGKNASELIDDAVILEAKVMLKSTQNTVAQVAYGLHFSDAAAFNKFFKKQTSISPSKYREL